jgi:2-methylcitrate dehydratase PrpD
MPGSPCRRAIGKQTLARTIFEMTDVQSPIERGTVELANFVVDTSFAELPDAVVERTKVHVLDVLATGFLGSSIRWAKLVCDFARGQGSSPQSSVFGQTDQMSVSNAALVNGVMVSCFEADHSGHTAHPAGTVLPGALAVAEHAHSTGRDLMVATALGYEVACRIGDAQTRSVEDERGFHNPGGNGPFSAAAAVGKLLDLDADQQASAFGIAGSHSGGLVEYAWDGSMTKRLHLGLASRGGLESAFLSAAGFTGPKTILEGRYGYFHAFAPTFAPEKLLGGLGEEWRGLTTKIKAYPCHGTSQGVVAAIQDLKKTHDINPTDVRAVHLKASSERLLIERFLDPAPTAHLLAQCSLPYTISVAFHRDLSDPLQFDESVLHDDSIRSLATKVSWQEENVDNDPLAAILEVDVSGREHVLRAGAFRGSLSNPADLDDVEDKFRRYSRHVVDQQRQDEIVEMVRDLDNVTDVSDLISLIRA